MKITKIEKEGYLFYVTSSPNLIERILGKPEKTETIKDMGMYVGKTKYIDDRSNELPIGHPLVLAIEEFRSKK